MQITHNKHRLDSLLPSEDTQLMQPSKWNVPTAKLYGGILPQYNFENHDHIHGSHTIQILVLTSEKEGSRREVL